MSDQDTTNFGTLRQDGPHIFHSDDDEMGRDLVHTVNRVPLQPGSRMTAGGCRCRKSDRKPHHRSILRWYSGDIRAAIPHEMPRRPARVIGGLTTNFRARGGRAHCNGTRLTLRGGILAGLEEWAILSDQPQQPDDCRRMPMPQIGSQSPSLINAAMVLGRHSRRGPPLGSYPADSILRI
ncbi:hypothetical protein B0H14DRAFT_2567928 [Mycena olivaceomarginata]|nr:hypothetical protein B0H14DRAFT_2567928 [Mycena olivaceomarginata]